MKTKLTKRVYFAIIIVGGLILLIVVLNKQVPLGDQTYPTLTFQVDKALLGTTVTDTALNMTMAAPKGWTKIDDLMLAQVETEIEKQLQQGQVQSSLHQIFLEQESSAVCSLTSFEDVTTKTLLSSWNAMLQEMYPETEILRTTFLKDTIPIHQFMIITPTRVHIKLICEAAQDIVFAVDYVVPKNVYEKMLRSIESSIGSIQLINNQ